MRDRPVVENTVAMTKPVIVQNEYVQHENVIVKNEKFSALDTLSADLSARAERALRHDHPECVVCRMKPTRVCFLPPSVTSWTLCDRCRLPRAARKHAGRRQASPTGRPVNGALRATQAGANGDSAPITGAQRTLRSRWGNSPPDTDHEHSMATTVRVLIPLSGPDGSYGRGDLYSCDDEGAARLIAAGIAEATTEPEVVVGVIRRPEPKRRRRSAK
jgi:hypothetical protein